ncbi:MAG: hypothetical protein ACTSPI_01280 [Candidatus Heimdallarchaeaceae archaeon]
METTIVKIEGNKIQAVIENDVKEFELEEWVKPEFVKLGVAEITIKNGKVAFCAMKKSEKKETKQESKPATDRVVNIRGKDYVTYAGLLDLAHEKGLKNFEILTENVAEDMTRAWVKVRAYCEKDGKEIFFDGIGSSTPENTGDMTQSHPIEMAHTRAKFLFFKFLVRA